MMDSLLRDFSRHVIQKFTTSAVHVILSVSEGSAFYPLSLISRKNKSRFFVAEFILS